MSDHGEQVMRDIIAALSTAMVQMVRSIEAQHKNDSISRQPVSVAIRNAAQSLPSNLTNRQLIQEILLNISVELDGNLPTPLQFPHS